MNAKKLLLVVFIAGTVVALPFVNRIVFGVNSKEVNVSTLSQRVISPSILASGYLAHEEEVMLSSEIIGKVAALFVEEGDVVVQGDLVLRVDDKNFIAGLEQSEAAVRINTIDIERQIVRIDNLERQFERSKSLYERSLIGEEEYEVARNQFDLSKIDLLSARERLAQASAQLDQVNDNLSKTQVISPINGVITSLDIKVGETAIASSTNIPGSSLMTIANPDQPMQGVVRFIANTAKVAQGRQGLSFVVKIDIADPGAVILRPGMSCRAEIFTRQDQEVTAVPIQAIIFEEDRAELRSDYFIFVNDNGIAKKTKVEVGLSDDEYQELMSEIDENVEVVIGPNQQLRHLLEGDRLNATRVEQQ